MKIQVFTDGSYKASKSQGGVGLVWVLDGQVVMKYSKGYKDTTNNQMELLAIKVALYSIKKPMDEVTIITDSEYSLGCITNPKWNPKKNVELINSIKELLKEKQKLAKIEFMHTRGHQTDDSKFTRFNNLADIEAQKASECLIG